MLPIITAVLVLVVLPVFVLRAGGKAREVAYAALGFVVAALPISVLFALTSPGLGGGIGADPLTLLGLTALFYVFSITFTLLFGVPLFLLLRRFDLVRWWSCAVAGAAVGAVMGVLILGGNNPLEGIEFLFLCSSVGALSALAFWAIWLKGVATKGTGSAGNDPGGVPSA